MLDHFTVFTKGGVVLFKSSDTPLVGNPVNNLIASVLLEERTGERSWNDGPYLIKWTFANDYDLVFVAVHQKVLQLLYVDELLDSVRTTFCELVNPSGQHNPRQIDYTKLNGAAFAPAFQSLHDTIEAKHIALKSAPKTMRTFEQTEKGKQMAKDGKIKAKKKKKPAATSPALPDYEASESDEEIESGPSAEPNGTTTTTLPPVDSQELEEGELLASPPKTPSPAPTADPRSPPEDGQLPESEEERARRIAEFMQKKGASARGMKTAAKPKPKPAAAGKEPSSGGKKPPKVARKGSAVTKEELEELDVAKAMGKAPAVVTDEMRRQFMGEKPLNLNAPVDEQAEEDDEELPKKGFFSSMLSSWTNRTLERKDVDPILAKFRDHLISKNVATEIADKLCESIASSMVGTTMSSFKSINTALKAALKDSLTRILTPKKSVNILLDIDRIQKTARRPYSIAFVGVNGVGKSTSLSKVCFWLQQNGLRVMIAACDTFRSGAVEQLRVHSQCLNTFLYEKGYGKDAAEVARDALAYAKDNRYDVVLIDTAGRMEGNEPLMRALAKLVTVNNPDLILFVGEALVGNKAVEQLTKFNQALIDMSEQETPRVIDGIFLTKFDTIDDKVGAALSMVYTTGQPIVFLGVGQHYHSVRAFSVDHVLPPLLKVA